MAERSAQKQTSIIAAGSNNRTVLIIAVVIAVLVIFGVLGYLIQTKSTKEMSEATEQNGQTSADTKNGQKQTTVETENGKIIIKEGEAPTNFPSDLTIYKDAKIERSTEAKDELSVILKTSDSVSKVTKFYEDDLKDSEWESVETNTMKGSSLITAKKGAQRLVITVTTDKETGKTAIAIVVGTPE